MNVIPKQSISIINCAGLELGTLRPITQCEAYDPQVITDLTAWRNANRRFFLTQFQATENRTQKWLEDSIISDKSRVLFLIKTLGDLAIGHIGVKALTSKTPELDNLLRGRSGGDPMLIYWAEFTVIKWIFNSPFVESVTLNVFSNNWIPIGIHQSLGFEANRLRQLFRSHANDEEHLVVESSTGELQRFGLLEMSLSRHVFEEHLIRIKKDNK